MPQQQFIIIKPLWNRNQMVSYTNNKGGVSRGRITSLDTHYNRTNGNAYHIYCIYKEGNKRNAWISEKDIIEGN